MATDSKSGSGFRANLKQKIKDNRIAQEARAKAQESAQQWPMAALAWARAYKSTKKDLAREIYIRDANKADAIYNKIWEDAVKASKTPTVTLKSMWAAVKKAKLKLKK